MIQPPFVDEKQSKKILPVLSKYENKIKVAIVLLCLALYIDYRVGVARIEKIVKEFEKELPADLIDRENFVQYLYKSGIKWLTIYKTQANEFFLSFKASAFLNPEEAKKLPKRVFDSPKKALEYINDNPRLTGQPNLQEYGKHMSNLMNELGYKQADADTGATLWQKVELDLRHEAQMRKVKEAQESGKDLFWLSSHVDCSERCEPWQGKLVSMSLPPINKKMLTGKRAGRVPIYSFKGITEQVDKYGYQNNIIVGFNCRHRLIPFNGETKIRPDNYSANEIKRERAINSKMRSMEHEIRRLKAEARCNYAAGFKKRAYELSNKASILKKKYIDFATKNDMVWYDYRIK